MQIDRISTRYIELGSSSEGMNYCFLHTSDGVIRARIPQVLLSSMSLQQNGQLHELWRDATTLFLFSKTSPPNKENPPLVFAIQATTGQTCYVYPAGVSVLGFVLSIGLAIVLIFAGFIFRSELLLWLGVMYTTFAVPLLIILFISGKLRKMIRCARARYVVNQSLANIPERQRVPYRWQDF